MLVIADLALVAFFFTLVLTPYVRDAARKLNLFDQPDASRKLHVQPIPRVGGVAVALGYTLACAFILIAPYTSLEFDLNEGLTAGFALLPAALVIFITGLLDDIFNLKPWLKLTGQVVGAGLAFWAGFGVHVLHGNVLDKWISFPITVLWLVLCTNAFNLIDGMDGLAAGIGLFAAITTLVAALMQHNIPLAMVTAPLAGSLLGFLRYNFNPASIFLGDSGSLLVGFLLGCYGAMWGQKSATILGMTAPLMALAIPLMDASLSILRRFLRRQPIFDGDRNHIHHRLLSRGLTTRRAALILYAICGCAAIFSLLQSATENQFNGVVIVLFSIVAWIGVQHLGYHEFGAAGKFLLKGKIRDLIQLDIQLEEFERSLREAQTLTDTWEVLLKGCKTFGFTGARLSIRGQIFEFLPREERAEFFWQVRIPLPNSQYVNFWRDMETEGTPTMLVGFVRVVKRSLVSQAHSPDSSEVTV